METLFASIIICESNSILSNGTWHSNIKMDIDRIRQWQIMYRLMPLGARVSVHDDVIKWKHFPRYWPFVRGIHQSLVNSPHKAQWRGALVFSLICAWINGWVNNRDAGGLGRHLAHYDVLVMRYNDDYFHVPYTSRTGTRGIHVVD